MYDSTSTGMATGGSLPRGRLPGRADSSAAVARTGLARALMSLISMAALSAPKTHPISSWRNDAPRIRMVSSTRPPFIGDFVLVAFLLAQVLDGALTYVGIVAFGPGIEGNPLLGLLMGILGEGPTLTGAKLIAGLLGITLHILRVHEVVALLTCVYLAASIVPWTTLLFF